MDSTKYGIPPVGGARSTLLAPRRLVLSADEVQTLCDIAARLARDFDTVENPEFAIPAILAAHELPQRVRATLIDFKLTEDNGALVIEGLEIDDEQLGPTPVESSSRFDPLTLQDDIVFYLLATLLGQPFGWHAYDNGRIVQDLVPLRRNAGKQVGNSASALAFHTEEAYHSQRPDYFGLMCMRNPDRVATTLAQMHDIVLDPQDLAELRREQFHILPDDNYSASNTAHVVDLREETRLISVIFGAEDAPYLRADPAYTKRPEQIAARRALNNLYTQLDMALQEVVLEPGHILFFDNHRTVHGRRSFEARYDGTDRWLKRLWATDNLRSSRHLRTSANDRAIIS